ncbi:MAG: hypothetical protein SO147_01485 [Clostridia bacterium]|nr:hypothetical protein [Clostridia bacterium]
MAHYQPFGEYAPAAQFIFIFLFFQNKQGLFRFIPITKNQSPASLLLLFRKKARSAQLLTCKCLRNVSLSLPPFPKHAPFGANFLNFPVFSLEQVSALSQNRQTKKYNIPLSQPQGFDEKFYSCGSMTFCFSHIGFARNR